MQLKYTSRLTLITVVLAAICLGSLPAITHAEDVIMVPPGIMVRFFNDPDDPDIQIVGSAAITSMAEMIRVIDYIMADPLYFEVKRNRRDFSYLAEWRAHNWMFDRNIRPDCTMDVDFQEYEAPARLCAYSVLSLMYGYKKGGQDF
jgi:hypothetical protein